MCFKPRWIWIRCDTNGSSRGGHSGVPVSTVTVSGFRGPLSICSFPSSLCLCALVSLHCKLLTAHQKSIGLKASGHVFHCDLCGQWRVIVKSFDFALFHQTLNCADGSSFFSDFPLHSFMVNDKLCSLYTHSRDICQLREPICVPFIGLDQGSPTGCLQAPPPPTTRTTWANPRPALKIAQSCELHLQFSLILSSFVTTLYPFENDNILKIKW